ncbi:hypothetical protein [Sporolituus thermophilus]|uniref:Uncharacterized protein n=1 Tax=Sporolituus thermophilus DSM 23256 TaxID=1123285 RepID=A0A1G7NF98_9FIRM|nr:hypothetical protein [Sporolituus thermophilus]SDF72642.1 hypothetical protein SAMN05660235_02544 [Sporolituus thermophilus DSM 23256]
MEMERFQALVLEKLTSIETRLERIEQRLANTEPRFDSIGQIANLQAQLDKLSAEVATRDDLAAIEAKIGALNMRLLNQEAEVLRLKLAK